MFPFVVVDLMSLIYLEARLRTYSQTFVNYLKSRAQYIVQPKISVLEVESDNGDDAMPTYRETQGVEALISTICSVLNATK